MELKKNNSYKINQSNIKVLPTQNNKSKLIKHYDEHNIFILPSFTEGHPMVLLEALARRRPVVIFDEIKHVIGDKKGVFVEIVFGPNVAFFGSQVTKNLINLLNSLGEQGIAALIIVFAVIFAYRKILK